MKTSRFSLLPAITAAAVLVFTGCGPSDSAQTETVPLAKPPPSQTAPSKEGWLTSYDEGQQEAKATNKLMLLDFTGSDWCGWCIQLDKEVFSKPSFREYAKNNLVLVEVDFPKRKRMPDAMRVQNVRLANRYQVQGFPTVLVLNGDGQVVGALGYMEGGPDAFIAALEKIRKG